MFYQLEILTNFLTPFNHAFTIYLVHDRNKKETSVYLRLFVLEPFESTRIGTC